MDKQVEFLVALRDASQQLANAADTPTTTDNSMGKKNLSSAKEEIIAAQRVVVPVVAAATQKSSAHKETLGQKLGENEPHKDTVEVFEKQKTALLKNEPIHYHILPPNQPHPCDKYGCAREAKYKFGNSYYCHDKAISHFKELEERCRKDGFELIEDVLMLDV